MEKIIQELKDHLMASEKRVVDSNVYTVESKSGVTAFITLLVFSHDFGEETLVAKIIGDYWELYAKI